MRAGDGRLCVGPGACEIADAHQVERLVRNSFSQALEYGAEAVGAEPLERLQHRAAVLFRERTLGQHSFPVQRAAGADEVVEVPGDRRLGDTPALLQLSDRVAPTERLTHIQEAVAARRLRSRFGWRLRWGIFLPVLGHVATDHLQERLAV